MKMTVNETSERISLRPVSDTVGLITLHGELPECSGKVLLKRYYRHLEQLLRRRCEAIREPGELLLRTELYCPDDSLCSVHIEAQLRSPHGTFPFFTDGCVWETQRGTLLCFHDLTGKRFSVRKLLSQRCPRREPEWLLRTCPDWESRMRRTISRYRFYLEPDALVFYLPPMTLDFPLENNCRLPFPGKKQ